LAAVCHLATASFFLRPGHSKGLTRETIPPVSPFGVQGLGLESEPDPYYGYGGRFGKCSGGAARKRVTRVA